MSAGQLMSPTAPLADAARSWPCCPQCGHRRHTRCPICQTAGSEFPLGDARFSVPQTLHQILPAGADQEQFLASQEVEGDTLPGEQSTDQSEGRLALCSTCDEPFEPQYARWCEWCGHDYGRGYEYRRPPSERLTPQAIAVALGLAVTLVGAFAYFAFILQ